MATDFPRRGEVWWVAFDPCIGGKIRKTRPAIVISNNAANEALNRIQVVALTSNVDRVFPGEAPVSAAGQRRKAMSDQIATVSKLRLREPIGPISEADLIAVERAIRVQLGL